MTTKKVTPGPFPLDGRSVLIFGAKRTGIAAARFCLGKGARVVLADQDPKTEATLPADIRGKVTLKLGPHSPDLLNEIDLIILSPGVPGNLPVIEKGRRDGILVMAELELASHFISVPMVAVTGTNGKTTTATLLGELFQKAGFRIRTVGNIGEPLIGIIPFQDKLDLLVVEVSSFQLEECSTFHPKTAVILNCTPDHLDRYSGMEEYLAAKAKIAQVMSSDDILILNIDDPLVKSLGGRSAAREIWISTTDPVRDGYFANRHWIYRSTDGEPEPILEKAAITLKGSHNLENTLAAVAAAETMSVDLKPVAQVLSSFSGLPHRNEPVATINDVLFINDSKGTNLGALRRAVDSQEGDIILIAGGRDKGGDYTEVLDVLTAKVKEVFLLGEAAPLMESAWGEKLPCRRVASLEEAVKTAFGRARPGETILFSPACSSFDMYRDYIQRGETFRRTVAGLEGNRG